MATIRELVPERIRPAFYATGFYAVGSRTYWMTDDFILQWAEGSR